MTQQAKPSVELYESHKSSDRVSAHVNVKDESGDWYGDFWVDFEHRPRRDRPNRYVADWDTVKAGGNGAYLDDNPCFWMVESVVSELQDGYNRIEFQTIDSGKNDK